MKKYKADYGRYTRFELPPVEECSFGDRESFYEKLKNQYPDLEDCTIWDNLRSCLENMMESTTGCADETIRILLNEVLRWTKQRDAFVVALLLHLSWDRVEGLFACAYNNAEIADFVYYLRCSIK